MKSVNKISASFLDKIESDKNTRLQIKYLKYKLRFFMYVEKESRIFIKNFYNNGLIRVYFSTSFNLNVCIFL